MRTSILVLAALSCLAGCNKDLVDSAEAKEGDKAEAKSKLKTVDLAPLPLTIDVKGGIGAMDMSIGKSHSVTVDTGDDASVNVSDAEFSFTELKESYEKDTILFPFKKWEKQDKKTAILQFANEGKKGYIGLMAVEVGGKKYFCKTTGLDGMPSVDAAQKSLDWCKNLKAAK
ncbi:MAG: hypothetical protein JNL79_06595 [Myxococcales bacterium]|nr:hypothetical protein [Myxococcales bacterium]